MFPSSTTEGSQPSSKSFFTVSTFFARIASNSSGWIHDYSPIKLRL
ncbi:hypothetical protein LEP1GSC105_1795 [Leptospira interrogans str. UI 12758]|uniref:Uncharacterized protein n=1 Tax=Leptospira interrogans str. UI 12758 TaxID=1049938 RepID=A0A0E2D0U6_LEPIR|nr:hypothetical protein LEP1GSC105_1795 [Leptospira interrogans str. UI 12758]